jgi:hypothetical protein
MLEKRTKNGIGSIAIFVSFSGIDTPPYQLQDQFWERS